MANLVLDSLKTRELLDCITIGVLKSLEQHSGVTDVKMMDQKPADQSLIDAWEKRYMCRLPTDLKSFYQTSDGLLIQWSVDFKGEIVKLGRMEVNSIANLTKLTVSYNSKMNGEPTLADIETESDEEDSKGRIIPHFDERNRIYELDSCSGNGKVCLVYKDLKAGFTTSIPEIWFLTRALQWYYLSDNFTNYFRMMMIHLGIPSWQYLFTDAGLSPETKFWFHLYAPERLADKVKEDNETNYLDDDVHVPVNKINAQRLFKGKVEKKKTSSDQTKAKGHGTGGRNKTWNSKQLKSVTRSPQR